MANTEGLKTRLAGLLAPTQMPRPAGLARIEVIRDGAVAGACDLEDGEYRIGARADCDLVVPEAGIPHIAVLKVRNGGGETARSTLVPFVSGVSLNGQMLTAFMPADINAAATIAIGTTLLRLVPAETRARKAANAAAASVAPLRQAADAASGRFSLAAIDPRKLLIAAALLCAAAFVSMLRDEPGAGETRLAGAPGVQADAGPKVTDPSEMLKLARHQLAVADLADVLSTRLDGKTVVVEGSVTDRQEERYRALLAGLRRRSAVELRSQVKPVALPAQSQIAGVALAPVAMVVMQDGARFHVGDTLPKGWRIESITAQGIVLSRDSLRETIPLGGS